MGNKTTGDGNISSGRDTFINQIEATKNDYGVIEIMFEFVLKKIEDNDDTDTKSSTTRDKLIHIKDKIELNFKTQVERSEVKEYFTKLYTKINFVEKAFQSLDTEEQNDVHFYILNNYNSLKRNDDETSPIEILTELAHGFIPENQLQNPTYKSIAHAIILFFFDDCTIFEKTSKEPIFPNLFDGL